MITDPRSTEFGQWLEGNGVRFTGMDEWPVSVPFKVTIDLASLKEGIETAKREACREAVDNLAGEIKAFLDGDGILYSP